MIIHSSYIYGGRFWGLQRCKTVSVCGLFLFRSLNTVLEVELRTLSEPATNATWKAANIRSGFLQALLFSTGEIYRGGGGGVAGVWGGWGRGWYKQLSQEPCTPHRIAIRIRMAQSRISGLQATTNRTQDRQARPKAWNAGWGND